MAKSLMIQGTGSGVGKTFIVAGLCRIFRDMGIDVAPFKAQNMALNSFVTKDGGEIGRAQVLQAEAARIEPEVDMNPILLKASGEMGSQVIVHGKVHSSMKAKEYYEFKKTAWKAVEASFKRLHRKHELIVIEGAGNPAEINLMDKEIVNMAVARYAKAPVILVGDIDKGGVFASLFGTMKLLGRDSKYIKAFIINKFRGDLEILKPGLTMIQERTGRPSIGVLPYIHDTGLPEEDGMFLGRNINDRGLKTKDIRIVIVKLQYISNFTDFDPFYYEPDPEVVYSNNPHDIENADLVIIPGSKNTIKDLMFLKERNLGENIKRAFTRGIPIIGICGGYQMLGKRLKDPDGSESLHKEIEGIGLLNIETIFERKKTVCQTEAELIEESWLMDRPSTPLKGYEIHMGISIGDIGLFKLKRRDGDNPDVLDGSRNENCWGTYLHGIFEDDFFRRNILNHLREKKGLTPLKPKVKYSEIKEKAMDNLACIIEQNIDLDFIKRMVKL